MMSKDKNQSVSIILPCAGRGKRLNLPYPKELIKVNEKMSIIDYSFHHILESKIKPRVIVIIGPHKFDTARYLYEKYNDKINLVFIFQKANHKEITGAIKSAEHLFCDKNILLMPDTIIENKNRDTPLIDRMLKVLDNQQFVFAHKNERSVTRLKLFGALNIKANKVIDYEDKQTKNAKKFNAFWVSFGFKKEVFSEVISVINQSTLKKTNSKEKFRKSVIYKSLSVSVAEYIDIGTWTNLNSYLMRQYLDKSGINPEFLDINKK